MIIRVTRYSEEHCDSQNTDSSTPNYENCVCQNIAICIPIKQGYHIKYVVSILPGLNSPYVNHFEDNTYVRSYIPTINKEQDFFRYLREQVLHFLLVSTTDHLDASACNFPNCPVINYVGHNNQRS